MSATTSEAISLEGSIDPRSFASAMLNILEDAGQETSRLASTQSAVLNILDDIADERSRFDATYRAVLNILDDAAIERLELKSTQQAVMNVLDDSAGDKLRLEATQRAVMNILEDFDGEKRKVEQVNSDLRNEIMERARAEQALRRATAATEASNKELEAFSYSVAHDLRAPLRSIDGFSQALVEDYGQSLNAEATRYLNHIRAAAQQMAELIDDLLYLSRITRAELGRDEVNLSDVARSVIGRLRDANPEREVEVLIAPNLTTEADPKLLEIVLTNLLGNAWKFTGNTPAPRIEFGAEPLSDPTVFFVRDNGAGFDQRYVDKLFGVFQRLHSTAEFEGTGIGLATVRRIVLRHGGRVWADGEVGRGATFHFTLEEGEQ